MYVNKRVIVFLSILSLSLSTLLIPATAAAKAGAKCTKVGSKSVVGVKTFTCIKSGKKLVWNKGIKVVAGSNPTPASAPTNITDCKLPVADGRGDVSIGGWPRIDERLKSTGDVTATVVMVDFPDAPASMTPTDAFARISPAADVFKEMSYGKFNYTFKPKLKWYRMSKNSSDYVAGGWTFIKHRDYITEAAKLADADIDFSKTDSLIILANPDARGMGYSGPAFAATRKSGITLDGKYISNGATSAYDLNDWKSIWLNHEVTHTLGLVDLYAATQSNPANRYDGFRYTGEFSYMGFSSYESNAPSLLAFERWNLGWINDSQINCLKDVKSTILISPVQTSGGVKAVIIPISRTKALVIESRRASGIDKNIAKSGALVYVVDSSIQSGQGPVKVFPSDVSSDPRYLNAPRALGESVTTEGVTVKVTKSDDSGDTVEITKS
jgi:M6 family metalloprotease-like protein